jgi:bifunctional DNase/RNase
MAVSCLPPPSDAELLLKAEQVEALVAPNPPHTAVIVLTLEDGRSFTLYGVPYEIVVAINKLQNPEQYGSINARESVFEILLHFRDELKRVGSRLIRVVVDELDYTTGLYSAKAEFDLGGIVLRKKMIPSHAIYLALLFDKPIYVVKRLVDEQEEMERRMRRQREVASHEVDDEEEEV